MAGCSLKLHSKATQSPLNSGATRNSTSIVSDFHRFFQIPTLGELTDYLAKKEHTKVTENSENAAVPTKGLTGRPPETCQAQTDWGPGTQPHKTFYCSSNM